MRTMLFLFLVASLVACSGRNPDQAFFSEVGALSKEEILAKGDAAAADKDFPDARRYYSFLADSFPNDPVGREAALKVADSFFNSKDKESVVEAQLRYKDFANRFPNDSNRAYALLMLGKTYHKQQRGPLRDLGPLKEAAAAFKQVVELYPSSPLAKEAQAFLDACNRDLALHELQIARYYFNVGAYQGAYQRLTYLLENFSGTEEARQGEELLKAVEEKRNPPPQ